MTVMPESVETVAPSREDGGAPAPPTAGAEQSETPRVGQTLYLLGRPPLKDFLRYVRNHAVDPQPEGALVEAWQGAAKLLRRIEQEEAGAADNPSVRSVMPDE